MILLIHKVLNYLFKGEVNIMLKNIKKGISVLIASSMLVSGVGSSVISTISALTKEEEEQIATMIKQNSGNTWSRRIEDMAINSVFNFIFGIISKPISEYIQSFSFLSPDSYTISNYIENMNESCEKELKKVRSGKMSEQDAKYRNAIGRDSEILEISNIVSRGGMKSNPILTGSAGVGKTATIEGLVWRIVSANMDIKDFKNNIGKAKDLTKDQKNQMIEKFESETVKKYGITKSLLNKKVINVNAVSLIVGNSYATSGGMEGAIRRFRALFDKYKGRKDVVLFIDEIHQLVKSGIAELLKKNLDRGDVPVIGATTSAEFKKYMEEDEALKRRFSMVALKELDYASVLEILKNRRPGIEDRQSVKIEDSALETVVDLTTRYMRGSNQPDKSICTLATAANAVREKDGKIVTADDIRDVVSNETKIPLGRINADELKKLQGMDENISKNILGQDEAVKTICDSIRVARSGVRDISKPRASYLITGITGSGKTALAEAVGKEVGSTIKIDMKNYSHDSALADLTGTKMQKYNGELVEQIWKNPYSVVIFDNIEKANPRVLTAISSMLENGYMMDMSGQKIDFSNAIVLMTTKAGSNLWFDVNISKEKDDVVKSKICEAVTKSFGEDFVSKLDDVIVLNKLTENTYKQIIRKFFGSYEHSMNNKNIDLSVKDDVVNYMFEKINVKLGAGQVRKVIENEFGKKLASYLNEGKIKKNDSVIACMKDGKIDFEQENDDALLMN